MRKNSIRKFRFEIICYSLLSLVFTLISEGILFGGIWIVLYIVNPAFLDHMGLDLNNSITSITRFNSDNSSIRERGFNRYYQEYPFGGDIRLSIRINQEVFFTIIIMAVVLGIALFILYFLLLTRKFNTYLDDITDGIMRIYAGDFKSRIPVKSVDEFGLIADRLNQVSQKIDGIMEERRLSESRKNELITSMAHDLRTPLTSIIGYLSLVSSDKNISNERKKHYIEVVYNKAVNLEKLVEDLFEYTKVTFREINMNISEINMVNFINQLVDEFYPNFQENDLEYDIKIEGMPLLIEGDGDLLARAITNLISNAIKYGKDGKRVVIRLKKEKEDVILQVINYGQLIPEEDIPHIFERFYRVEGSRSSETGGTGLGLSIAKEIIEMHGGTIEARSDFNGTVFITRLKGKGGEGNE